MDKETPAKWLRYFVSIALFIGFLLTVFFPETILAQDTITSNKIKPLQKQYSLGLVFGYGYIFPASKFLDRDNMENAVLNKYRHLSARILFQPDNKPWYQQYGFPYIGFGIQVSNFYDRKELGIPIALYGLLNAPFYRRKKLTFDYEIDFGLAFNWKHFNPVTNKFNVAIGAGETAFIHMGIGLTYRFAPKWETEFNIGVAHVSNGGLKIPNWGINTLSPQIEVRYKVHGHPELKKQVIPPFKKIRSIRFTTYFGLKNVISLDSVSINTTPNYKGIYLPIMGFRTDFGWQISPKSRFGVGIDAVYDGSEDYTVKVENNKILLVRQPLSNGLRISIFPSYNWIIGPFFFIFQPGIYIYRKKIPNQVPLFYQRIGLNYTIANHFIIGINLRAFDFKISEFIEWSISYQLSRTRK